MRATAWPRRLNSMSRRSERQVKGLGGPLDTQLYSPLHYNLCRVEGLC